MKVSYLAQSHELFINLICCAMVQYKFWSFLEVHNRSTFNLSLDELTVVHYGLLSLWTGEVSYSWINKNWVRHINQKCVFIFIESMTHLRSVSCLGCRLHKSIQILNIIKQRDYSCNSEACASKLSYASVHVILITNTICFSLPTRL